MFGNKSIVLAKNIQNSRVKYSLASAQLDQDENSSQTELFREGNGKVRVSAPIRMKIGTKSPSS